MDGSTERRAFGPAQKARGPGPLVRFIPAGILVLVILGFLSSVLPPRGGKPGPGGPSQWLPMARGEISFLGASRPFLLLRRGRREAFRAEEEPGTAFESPRLESLVQMFLRQKLAGVQVKETVRVRLEVEPGEGADPGFRPGLDRFSLDWRITLREVSEDREAWFLLEQEIAEPAAKENAAEKDGAGESAGAVKWRRGPLWGETLRSLAELKEKVARELAREVLALFPDAA